MYSKYIIDGLGIFVGGVLAVAGIILVDTRWIKAVLIVVGTAIFLTSIIYPLMQIGISWWFPRFLWFTI